MEQQGFATREEFWRLQEALNDLSTTQAQHSDRLIRLEKQDGGRMRSTWGSASPFHGGLGNVQSEPGLNPAAEAFRNFDADPGPSMMSSLSLDVTEDSRRAQTSRANSVRFDESANNHYGLSRQSIDLPARAGSGLGAHPLSERSLSHRSDGRASALGFPRANSFGLETSRLLGSINNSPKVAANPPPGFFILGPCPSIIRCWLSETFSNDSLLYAAVCTGSAMSSIGSALLQKLNIPTDAVGEEGGVRKVKLSVYLTEAKIHLPSSRSASPAPQVPTIDVKFVVEEGPFPDRSIQLVLGSDVLRSHNADVLFSQDKLLIFDEDRNQLSVPLVRPEDDAVYKALTTCSRNRPASADRDTMVPSELSSLQSPHGIIGRPGRLNIEQHQTSPTPGPTSAVTSAAGSESAEMQRAEGSADTASRTSIDYTTNRGADDAKSIAESEQSATTPISKSNSGVWANSWRTGARAPSEASVEPKTLSTYSKPAPSRPMKVLRPSGKTMASASRTPSGTSPWANGSDGDAGSSERKLPATSAMEAKPTVKANPIGSGSAFGWLNSGQQKRPNGNGE